MNVPAQGLQRCDDEDNEMTQVGQIPGRNASAGASTLRHRIRYARAGASTLRPFWKDVDASHLCLRGGFNAATTPFPCRKMDLMPAQRLQCCDEVCAVATPVEIQIGE